MKVSLMFAAILLLLFTTLLSQNKDPDYQNNWPQWRGPLANGISPHGNPPTEWDEQTNIKWKIKLSGKGHATPIIWKNQIFLLSAIPTEKMAIVESSDGSERENRKVKTDKVHQFSVVCVNKNSGEILWKKVLVEEHPRDRTHQFGSWASNSPVTNGENLYAYFGSRGLYCLDMNGNLLWERDFGDMSKRYSHGEGSSPLLYEDKIVILWDHEGESSIFAVNKNSGEQLWSAKRDELSTWATPVFVEHGGKKQVITAASNFVRSYDLESGDIIWQCSGLTTNVIPTPVIRDNILFVMSGQHGHALLAIDLNQAKGDISNSDAVIWTYDKDTSYAPSPILIDNLLYFLKRNNGDLSCLDAVTGQVYYSKKKLEGIGELFTSPVAAGGRIYFTGRKGITFVIKHGTDFEVIARNQLDDAFIASPAISENALYLRGSENLYKIE